MAIDKDKHCGTCCYWEHDPHAISYCEPPQRLGDCAFPLPFWLTDLLSGLSIHAYTHEGGTPGSRVPESTQGCPSWKEASKKERD